jgi:hypothetical protein
MGSLSPTVTLYHILVRNAALCITANGGDSRDSSSSPVRFVPKAKVISGQADEDGASYHHRRLHPGSQMFWRL